MDSSMYKHCKITKHTKCSQNFLEEKGKGHICFKTYLVIIDIKKPIPILNYNT